MAGQEKKTSELSVVNTVASSDRIVVVYNTGSNTAQTATIAVSNLPLIAAGPTPANSHAIANLIPGTIWSDNTSIYWVIADGSIMKVPGSTF